MITLGNYTGFQRKYIRDGCTGKKAFESYREAEVEVGKLIRRGASRPHLGLLRPYACGRCHAFHLGHER